VKILRIEQTILLAVTFSIFSFPSYSDTETLKLGELGTPICADNFEYKNGICEANLDVKNFDENKCKNLGDFMTYGADKDDSTKKSCTKSAAEKPEPFCKEIHSYTYKLSGSAPNLSCQYERTTVSTSSQGDYIGDCFKLRAKVDGIPNRNVDYFVTNQDSQNKESPSLTLVQAGTDLRIPGWMSCSPAEAVDQPSVSVSANALANSGAIRRGFAYGFLTTPYKYYPSKKKFTTSVPIGAYLGWRRGQPGSSVTYALAATIGSVSADTIDPKVLDSNNKPTVTGSTDVAALSFATGIIFDILRSNSGSAFKAGILVGKDYINQSDSISYDLNKETWVAIQLGYDFTDN